MIRILTGPIRSHKTTVLQSWVSGRTDCGGVLSPDKDGLRQLYNIKGGQSIAWQKQEADTSTDVLIGRFVFDATAFQVAIGWLDYHINDPEIQHVILDEIGPLELSGKGWDLWAKKAFSKLNDKSLLLVVREGLVEKVVEHYGISNYALLTVEDFQAWSLR